MSTAVNQWRVPAFAETATPPGTPAMHLRLLIASAAFTSLIACAGVTPGPEVEVMPAPEASFEQFADDDLVCRDFAAQRSGAATSTPGSETARSAAAGAAAGAVAGAMIGRGDGDAIGTGAGAGLILGGAHGMERAHDARDTVQYRYDTAYMQCMYAKGHQVPGYGRSSQRRR